MQIQKVEEHFGFVIFDRNKKPVLPTDKGVRFIRQATKVLAEHEKLVTISQSEGDTVSGSFRLGVIPTLTPYVVPLFLQSFAENFPLVDLTVDELKTSTIVEQLRVDRLDGAILATPLDEKGIRERVLFYEPFHLYLNQEHPLLKRDQIDHESIQRDEIWLLEDGHCLRNQIVNYCSFGEESGVFKNVLFEGGNLETLRYMVNSTRGYTLIPELFCRKLSKQERKTNVRPFASPIPTREVSLVHRRDHWKIDIIASLIKTIKSTIPKDLLTHGESSQVLDIY